MKTHWICVAARESPTLEVTHSPILFWQFCPAVAASVSQPALGFRLSPSPVVLTSIRPASGASTATTGRRPPSLDDISPRNVADPVNGTNRTVASTNVSHFAIAGRVHDDKQKRFVFISPSTRERSLSISNEEVAGVSSILLARLKNFLWPALHKTQLRIRSVPVLTRSF